jgi:hypothetical protein
MSVIRDSEDLDFCVASRSVSHVRSPSLYQTL